MKIANSQVGRKGRGVDKQGRGGELAGEWRTGIQCEVDRRGEEMEVGKARPTGKWRKAGTTCLHCME